jgi:hypothetical protein
MGMKLGNSNQPTGAGMFGFGESGTAWGKVALNLRRV